MKHDLLANGISMRPIALGELLADNHLIGCAEHLVLIARKQAVVEELEEVRSRQQNLCWSLLTFDGECNA